MRRSAGFTLVELLVVIAIIGVLVALLLPAVQAARSAARRTMCQNNLKQIGISLLNYHDQFNEFPPSVTFDPTRGEPSVARTHFKNWVIAILPFMEQQNLYDQFDFEAPINSRLNSAARGTRVPAMLCAEEDSTNQDTLYIQDGGNWARGNYAANACMGAFSTSWRAGAGADSERWKGDLTRGVMGANVSTSIAQITDGTTNTIMVGEIRVGIDAVDRRGTWALGGPGASSLWMHGSDDANGVNVCTLAADNIQYCADIFTAVGEATVASQCMGCNRNGGDNTQTAARSNHPGGIFVCMVDGSVQFLSDFIDTLTIWDLTPYGILPNELGTWQRLNASADSAVVSPVSL
jgi:prepilin-type N-terminal cleavage/methylation domain-containing protein